MQIYEKNKNKIKIVERFLHYFTSKEKIALCNKRWRYIKNLS